MDRRRSLTRTTLGLVVTMTALAVWSRTEASSNAGPFGLDGVVLEATKLTPLQDSDGDLLPDMLEHVVQSVGDSKDSDGDGRDDFIEQLEYSDPMLKDASNLQNDGFRILLHTTSLPNNEETLWIHLMFRMRSGLWQDLQALSLFLESGGDQRFPLDALLTSSVAEIRDRMDPVEGLLVRVSLKVPTPASLRGYTAVTPITIGGFAKIYGKIFMAGSMLLHNNVEYLTLAPVGSKALVAQTTNSQSTASPFWSTQKRCKVSLAVIGAGRHGLWCEVSKADCEPSHKAARCTPACPSLIGGTFIVPDGLPFVIGG
ncbi:MAG: hypothetical protein KDC95_14125 [Planctomycetes bacterium]|nr:hypothetical protein [Planctomycetota bacterium]